MLRTGQLTTLERAILEDLARGHEPAEIAHARDIDETHLEAALLRAREKLGARNEVEAVARGLIGGVLRPAECMGLVAV